MGNRIAVSQLNELLRLSLFLFFYIFLRDSSDMRALTSMLTGISCAKGEEWI